MSISASPLHFLLFTLAGWVNRHQQAVIEYLQEENRVLKDQLRGKRLRLNDDQRRRLAVKGKVLGRKLLSQFAGLVTPDTLLAWHRRLIANKWDFGAQRKGPGRPGTARVITELVVRMAGENSWWGYTRIQGALANLGHRISRGTVANILREHGIEPAPERGTRTTWRTFLQAHWETLAAADFFTVEVSTWRGLVTYYVLIVVELSSRRVCLGGVTRHPDHAFMMQVARNLKDSYDGFLLGKRYHPGLDKQLIEPEATIGDLSAKIECRERLGGLLKYYYRAAA